MRRRAALIAASLMGFCGSRPGNTWAACPVKAPVYDYAKEPDPRKSEYVLGVGDALSINVWENGGHLGR